jgi:hypothetical protein
MLFFALYKKPIGVIIMIEVVKQRIQGIIQQKQQGEAMKSKVAAELNMIEGALQEAQAFLNYLTEQERITAETKAAEVAAKPIKTKATRKSRKTVSEATEVEEKKAA